MCASSVFIDSGKDLLGQCEIVSQAKWNQMCLLIRLFQTPAIEFPRSLSLGFLLPSGRDSFSTVVPKKQEWAELEDAGSQLSVFLAFQRLEETAGQMFRLLE